MKIMYKKCELCDGKGYFPQPPPLNITVPPNYFPTVIVCSEENKCHKCNGVGMIEIAYISEEY